MSDSDLQVSPPRRSRLRRFAVIWGWLSLVVIGAVYTLVPSARPSFGVWLWAQYALLQLWLVARSKTITWRAYGLAFSAGVFAVAPLSIWLTGLVDQIVTDPLDYVATIKWNYQRPVFVAGPLEETLKLLPLLVFLVAYRLRGQILSAADCALVAFASGTGFQFVEDSLRQIRTANSPLSLFQVLTPDVGVTHHGVLSLFPGGMTGQGHEIFSPHGVTTGLIGACVGLAIHGRRRLLGWLTACIALAWMAVEHSLFNWRISGSNRYVAVPDWLERSYEIVGSGREVTTLLFVLVIAAVTLDYKRIARVAGGLPGHPVGLGLMRSAYALLGQLRESAQLRVLQPVFGTVVAVLRAALMSLNEILHVLASTPAGVTSAFVTTAEIRQRRCAGLSRKIAQPRVHNSAVVGIAVVVLGAAAIGATATHGSDNLAFLASYFDALGRWWNSLPWWQQALLVVGTAALGGWMFGSIGLGMTLATTATGIAAHGQGTATFVRNPRQAVTDWWRNVTPAELALIAGTEIAGRFVPAGIGSIAGKHLYKLPVEDLRRASPEVQAKLSHLPPDDVSAYYTRRVEALAPDTDHGFKVRAGSLEEAEIGAELEWRGIVDHIDRPGTAGHGDFIDINGQHWDVKSYYDGVHPAFDSAEVTKAIQDQIEKEGRKVILNLSHLEENRQVLREIVEHKGWQEHVIWYPPE